MYRIINIWNRKDIPYYRYMTSKGCTVIYSNKRVYGAIWHQKDALYYGYKARKGETNDRIYY